MKTKLIIAISLLVLGAATQANAANVIVHRHVAPVVVVKPVDIFSWTGLYLNESRGVSFFNKERWRRRRFICWL